MNKLQYIFLSLIIGFAAQAMEEPSKKQSMHEQLEEAASRGDLEEVKKVLDYRIFLEFLNRLRKKYPKFYAVKDVLKLCFTQLLPFKTKRYGDDLGLADAARFNSQVSCELILKAMFIPPEKEAVAIAFSCDELWRNIFVWEPDFSEFIVERFLAEDRRQIAFDAVNKIEEKEIRWFLLRKYFPDEENK